MLLGSFLDRVVSGKRTMCQRWLGYDAKMENGIMSIILKKWKRSGFKP